MSDKYEFIDAEYADHAAAGTTGRGRAPSITKMCAWLGVSTSGFHEWRTRPTSATAARREELKLKIEALFASFDKVYGYRRIHAQLRRAGERVGPALVRKLMRELGLVPCQPRPYKTTTVRGETDPATPDLVARDFTAERPGSKLVSDITFVATWQGWLYVAIVLDCFNSEVVGYAMADHMRTSLVTDALDMAARNHRLQEGCIFHSDRGTQYTSAEFADAIKKHELRASLGRTGVCYDNALAESFNSMLKNERVYRDVYPTRKKAQQAIARYIEIFYNRRRIHSSYGYRTPQEVRTQYLNAPAAA